MQRPSRAAVLSLAIILGLGCGQGEPDDVFFVFGKVVDQQGAPLSGAEVILSRTEGAGCSTSMRPSVFEDATSTYRDYRNATAIETGEYLFELMRFELQTPTFASRCLRIRHEGQDGAFSVLQTFAIPDDVEAPDLVLWHGQAPTLATNGPSLEARFGPLPWEPTPLGSIEIGPDYRPPEEVHCYDWAVHQDGKLAWHQQTTGEALALTPEIREDFGAAVALDAMTIIERSPPQGPFSGPPSSFRSLFRSGSTGPLPPGRVPASRGASCSFRGEPLEGCPATDGLLDLYSLQPVPEPGSAPSPTVPDEISIRLPAPIRPTLLVVRDLHTFFSVRGMLVEGSADGVAWEELGRIAPDDRPPDGYAFYESFLGTGQHVQIPLDSHGRAVQHVRLVAVDGAQFFAVRELSVFGSL
jgi:hypothetical protein